MMSILYLRRDVFKADGKFSEEGVEGRRGGSGRGGFIQGEGRVFEEHESSGSSHQESSNQGGLHG